MPDTDMKVVFFERSPFMAVEIKKGELLTTPFKFRDRLFSTAIANLLYDYR